MSIRNILFFVIIIMPLFSYGQRKVIFIDSMYNFPIEHVHVFSMNNKLISISNSKGEVLLNNNTQVIVKCSQYLEKNILTSNDTIFLIPKIQILDEVIIKPMEISVFYKRIIDSSKVLALNDVNKNLEGIYFESVLIIDLNNGDSIFQTKECILNITKKQLSKSKEYSYNVSQGRKSYWVNTKNEHLDTSAIDGWSNIIPKLNSLFEYDLSNDNKFKINFKDKIVTRKSNEFLVSEKRALHNESFNIEYLNGILTSWNNSQKTMCDNSSKIAMCFELTSKTLEYNYNDQGYYLENGYLYGIIQIKVHEKNFIIKLKKGFIENPISSDTLLTRVKNVEDYFETIQNIENSELINFYIFTK